MSAADFTLQLGELRRQKLFRQITQSVMPVHSFAHLAAYYERALTAAEQKLQMLREINLELMMSDAKRRAGYFSVLIAALAVYSVDFILLSSVAEYFARRVYSDPFMVGLARLVIPAAILTIEIMIASQRAFAQEWAGEYGARRPSRIWVSFSVLLLLVLPTMLVATHIVSMPAKMTQVLATVNVIEMIGLVALAVVMHGVVLYGGPLAVEAKAFLYLNLHQWKLNREIRRFDNRYQNAATSATHAYILHERAVQEYRALFPNSEVTPGPFDLTTHRLLRTRLGRELPGLPMASDTVSGQAKNNMKPDA